jgi:hypothetical protein
MPRNMRMRNRMAFDVAVEERAEEEEESIYEKEYPFGGCPEIKTEDVSDPISTDSSLLSPPTFSKPRSLLSVHSLNPKQNTRSLLSVHSLNPKKNTRSLLSVYSLNPKKNTLSIHSREPSLRASRLEVSCAIAGRDPNLLPADVVRRGKSTPNLHVVESMSAV